MIHRSFKRVFSLFILLLAGVLSMSAQQVTKEEALLKATQFFQQSDVVSRRATRKAPQFTFANNRNEFYVFNDEANGGYVVVSGDERMPDVLGYSYTGHFDAENIPCNMKAWLEDYAAQVVYLQTHPDVPASRRTAPERDEISPLLKCQFDQGKYYNNKCPIVDGEHCVTGCAATAMAQIMYYYQWPKQTTDVIPSYTTRTNKIDMPAISVTTIDWDNMLDKYSSWEDYSDEQIDAISTLMLLCGTSVEMDYGLGGSAAYTSSAAEAFRKYFDYDDMLEYINRGKRELGEWEQMIYDDLNDGHPVFYAGSSVGIGGHAFVLDGYKDGYFHVNWGWGGYQDDYFLLTDLNGYNYNQAAIVGIQAPSPDIPKRYAVLEDGKMTLYYDTEMSHRSGTVLPHMDEWSNYKDQITECFIDPSYANLRPKSLYKFFYEWSQLKSIEGIENLNTSNVTDMGWMFYGCSSLTNLDVSGFKTDNVTDMSGMFYGCSGLTSLDVSGFKTDNVTSMSSMFYGCSGLTSLDVSGFKTDNVTDMWSMFSGCSGLTTLDVSGLKTDNVTSMRSMFSGCSSLTSLDVSGFKTDNVTDMSRMFSGCSGLTSLDVSCFKTDNVTDMSWMFRNCSSLTSLDVTGFKTDNVTNMGWMFGNCSSLTSLDVSGFKTDNVTYMTGMFYGCSGLKTLDVSGFKTDKVTDMSWMFYGCSGLKTLDVSGFKTDNVTSISYMFSGCSGLTSLDVSGFKTDNVTDMSSMFHGCSSLTSLDLSGFKTDNVTNMGWMFRNCSSLTSLDVTGFKTDNVTNMGWMFGNCSSLTSLDVSGFKMDNVTNTDYMFYYCSGLTSITLPNSVTSIGTFAFQYCSGLTSVTIGSGIESIESLAFVSCPELTDVYCYAINVPSTATDAFKYSSIEIATLHVPAESVDAYKEAEPWKNFGTIQKIKDTVESKVKLSKTKAVIEKGKTLTLKAKVTPTTLDQTVTWKSSDKKVATVTSAGKVKGVGAGTATITCTSKATGAKATCKVTVGYVKLSKTEVVIEKGEIVTLKSKVYPSTVKDQSVTWESSDPTIVKVGSTGKIKGMKVGKATITCTSNATGLKATCEVTVGYVKLSKTEVSIEKGKTLALKAKVYPTTLDQTVTWKSSNSNIVKVTSAGKIKGLKAGTAIITCTSNATGLSATCKVTVVKASAAPSLDGTDDEVTSIEEKAALAEKFDVYDLNGRRVLDKATSLDGLSNGVYIVNGKKIVVKK